LDIGLKTKITRNFINELISSIRIDEYMESEYNSDFSQSSNNWLNTNCPFPDHEDSSPSFGVNTESNKFNCFGCGKTGNIINLAQMMENLNFVETIQKLSLYIGLDVETADFDMKYNVNQLNNIINGFLDEIETSQFPGGLSEADFLITFAERTKKHIRKSNFNKQEIEWVNVIYKNLDKYIDNEDYHKINLIWKKFAKSSQERSINWKTN